MAVKIGQPSAEGWGNVVRTHRKAAGLTQLELAKLAGVGKTAVFDIEHGKTTVRLATLLQVLDTLNLSLELRRGRPDDDHA